MTFGLLSVSLWNDLNDAVTLVGIICSFFLSLTICSFSFIHGLLVWGWALRIDKVFSLSSSLALLTHFNNNNNNNNNKNNDKTIRNLGL